MQNPLKSRNSWTDF